MLVTSLTSSVAFSACTTSQVMPIRAFGWFATLVVPLLFLQTILFQPFVYFFYEKYLLNERKWRNCLKKDVK